MENPLFLVQRQNSTVILTRRVITEITREHRQKGLCLPGVLI